MSVLENLKHVDIYGADFSILIKNSNKMNTFTGAILTILTFCFFVFVTISFGDNFYNKKNPIVIIQSKVFSYDEMYQLNNSTALPRLVILKMSKFMDDVSNFLIDASVPYSFQKNKTYGLVKPCNQSWVLDNFYPEDRDFGARDINNSYSYLCYNIMDYKFGLGDNSGGQGSILVSPLSIWTFKCNGTTRGITGKKCPDNFDFTSNKIAKIEVWTEDVLFDQDNLENPFSTTLTRAGKYQFARDQALNIYLSMKIHKNFDNRGFLLDTEIETQNIGFGSVETIASVYTKPKDFYDCSLYIGYDKIFQRYHRSYMKIQDLLALVGGVLKFVITFCQAALFVSNDFFLIKYLRDNFYDYNSKSESKLPFNQILIQPHAPIQTASQKVDINNPPARDKSACIQDNSNVELQLNNKNIESLKYNNYFMTQSTLSRHSDFSFCQFVRQKFSFSNSALKKEIRNIRQKQGIENIFRLMKDVYLLKEMLLSPEQSKGLRLIKGKAYDMFDSLTNENQKLTEKEVFDYLTVKSRSNNLSSLDKKLLELISFS